MSYKKYCDICGREFGSEKKLIVSTANGVHRLSLEIRLTEGAGMGEFHICRGCTRQALALEVKP